MHSCVWMQIFKGLKPVQYGWPYHQLGSRVHRFEQYFVRDIKLVLNSHHTILLAIQKQETSSSYDRNSCIHSMLIWEYTKNIATLSNMLLGWVVAINTECFNSLIMNAVSLQIIPQQHNYGSKLYYWMNDKKICWQQEQNWTEIYIQCWNLSTTSYLLKTAFWKLGLLPSSHATENLKINNTIGSSGWRFSPM
jgi:hypothetical protein